MLARSPARLVELLDRAAANTASVSSTPRSLQKMEKDILPGVELYGMVAGLVNLYLVYLRAVA